jgi:hypothetical protein
VEAPAVVAQVVVLAAARAEGRDWAAAEERVLEDPGRAVPGPGEDLDLVVAARVEEPAAAPALAAEVAAQNPENG